MHFCVEEDSNLKNINKLILILIIIISILSSIILLPHNLHDSNNEIEEINLLNYKEKDKIEDYINKNLNQSKIPGLSITIVKYDKTIYQKGFGYSDIENKLRVNSKTLFEIGSNSKAVTALGILCLQKDGKLELQDQVSKYIPWLKVKYNGKEVPITIEQLLYQTSGIPFKTIKNIPISDKNNAIEETVRTLVGIELDSEPGKNFQYATINYDVLGLIIEKITRKSYESYIKENIFKPMGLNNTYLYKSEFDKDQMAKGYMFFLFQPRLYNAPVYNGNKPAGYIISSGEDMSKWLKFQLGTLNNSKLDNSLIEQSHKANESVFLDKNLLYASGWFVYSPDDVLIFHGGNNPNYSSYIILNPQNKIGVSVLCNMNSEYVEKIGYGIYEILNGKFYNKNVIDLNKLVDFFSTLIIIITLLIIVIILFHLVIVLNEVLKKERQLVKTNKIHLFLIISFFFMLAVNITISLIPYIFYYGLSWQFIFVWLPKTIKIALYLIYICNGCIYINFLITSIYKKNQKYV